MRILVLSDSHSMLSFMRMCIDTVHPDLVIHLGDYVKDGEAMAEEYPGIRFYQVPGNCDRYRVPLDMPQILVPRIAGVTIYMTHGHLHGVKVFPDRLYADARAARADAVLYGHTHEAVCMQEEDGLWVMNPGSCGYYGGSAGLLEVADGSIRQCRILRQQDLEEFQ